MFPSLSSDTLDEIETVFNRLSNQLTIREVGIVDMELNNPRGQNELQED